MTVERINFVNQATKEIARVIELEKVKYCLLEVIPSRLTSNREVKWLVSEFSRLYKPLSQRISLSGCKVTIQPELDVWWEVFLYKESIRFCIVVPDKDNIKNSIKRQIMKTWKQSSVKEMDLDYLPEFNAEDAEVTNLTLKYNSVLSLNTTSTHYSPLDSLLNAKHYLKDDDLALLQIGMRPVSNEWNKQSRESYESIKKGANVPRKKGKPLTKGEVLQKLLYAIGVVTEEVVNFVGDFLIPGWKNDDTMKESKGTNGELDTTNRSTREKTKSDGFKTEIRVLSVSKDDHRRKSISRAMASGFDPLEGDNKLEDKVVPPKHTEKAVKMIKDRKMKIKINGDILCSLELSKIINVPDQKAQIEHYNELSLVQHRGESEVPKEIFVDDGGIPFAKYEDTDGVEKTVYFTAKNNNLLCMPRVIIGEPGTGKTTFAQNFALEAFNKGYGVFAVDAADGKMIQRILDRVKPELRHKVKIIDFLNTENPIGLGWNEIFRGGNTDVVEDLIVDELLSYIELVSGTPLNMRSRQWVENAIKVVYTSADAVLQDVENMLNNADYREKAIQDIEDPELRNDWGYYHNSMKPEERRTIYDEAFRRLSPVMRKKALKNFILQRPKKDEEGNYLVDFRKWMDEGYLVLVKANESLGETLQTALVSFAISKFNLAMISREDIVEEDERRPCFALWDEPDHYIKGSEKWRNMLTRFRKYRCGLNLLFHGWQQLKEADRDLPKIVRKSGPHYVIFQTDEDNLMELKPVIEPEFKIQDIAKGMPQHHAVIRLKMYGKDGDVVPAFMAKSLGRTEDLFEYYNNNDLYEACALELGRPKTEVMEEIYKNKSGAEFEQIDFSAPVSSEGLGNITEEVEEELLSDHEATRIIEHEMERFFAGQKSRGEELDYDLLLHHEELMEGDFDD